jgi:uroporphyrinogen-III decarboxylase
LNSRDRLIAVLERREPDYVPIVLQSVISSRVSDELMKATGQNGRRGSTSPSVGITYRMYREFVDKLIKSNPSNWKEEFTKVANMVAVTPIDINLYTKLGVDGFFHAASNGRVRVLDENHVINEFGQISKFGDANGELMQWYNDGYLKTPEQRDQWEQSLPGPDRVKPYEAALKTCGERVYPIGFVVGIFELTWQSMGFTEFSRNLKVNPGFVRRVYSEHAKFAEELAKQFIDAGAGVLGIGDDVAYRDNLMVSPKMWAEFVQPHVRRIVNTIHKRGALVFMHSDGYITPLMDLIIGSGYDGIQSLEPLAGVKLSEVKKKYGERIGMIGGIDTSQLLPYGTENEVETAVRQAIRAAGKGGGYAIGPCTEIHWGCKAENVLAMIKYARKYGKYPLQK